MLNMLPKGIIVNNIVDTLKKDPEDGVVKLLKTAKSYAKTVSEQAMLTQIIDYYAASPIAKMQVRNLVYNTNDRILYAFAEKIFDYLSAPPGAVNFMCMMTVAEVSRLKIGSLKFPVIDLKNLNNTSKEVLANLKNNGQIFFVSIAVTEENFATVTSDEVILVLVKHGVRAVFYRISATNTVLEAQLQSKIKQIRINRPILAFTMKKDTPHSTSLNYIITESMNSNDYSISLNLN